MNRFLQQPSSAVRHLAAISLLIVLVGGLMPGRLAIAQAPDPAPPTPDRVCPAAARGGR